jgi:hypothetical protein
MDGVNSLRRGDPVIALILVIARILAKNNS